MTELEVMLEMAAGPDDGPALVAADWFEERGDALAGAIRWSRKYRRRPHPRGVALGKRLPPGHPDRVWGWSRHTKYTWQECPPHALLPQVWKQLGVPPHESGWNWPTWAEAMTDAFGAVETLAAQGRECARLRQAVIAAPDDREPRLALAAFLETHGDRSTMHARALRSHCGAVSREEGGWWFRVDVHAHRREGGVGGLHLSLDGWTWDNQFPPFGYGEVKGYRCRTCHHFLPVGESRDSPHPTSWGARHFAPGTEQRRKKRHCPCTVFEPVALEG